MKKTVQLLILTLVSTYGFAQCTTDDATDCQCIDDTQVDCDLLPDIQLSWYGLVDVSDGPTEYALAPQGNGSNLEYQPNLEYCFSQPKTGIKLYDLSLG